MTDTFIVDGRPFVGEIAELLAAVFVASEVEDALGRGRTWRVCVNGDGDVLGFIAWERCGDSRWFEYGISSRIRCGLSTRFAA